MRWLLGKAGAYIVEDLGPGERSVYRPFHDLLAAHLRGEPSDRAGRAMIPRPPTPGSSGAPRTEATHHRRPARHRARRHQAPAGLATAHPYLRTYLAQHAAAAGPDAFAALVQDADFLAVADPVTLSPLLSPTDPGATRDGPHLPARPPLLGDDLHANAAYLQEAARALTGTAALKAPSIRPFYRTHLASVRRDDSLLTLTGHPSAVTRWRSAPGPDGRLLLASGSGDGTVRLWDPVTGASLGELLAGHRLHPREVLVGHRLVNSVAFGTGPRWRLLLASGSRDGTVRCGTRSPAPRRRAAHRPHRFGVLGGVRDPPGGRLLLASGSDDETVRLWDPVTGARSASRSPATPAR